MAVDEPAMFASWRVLLGSGAKVLYPGHGKIMKIEEILPVFLRASARQARIARRLVSAPAPSPGAAPRARSIARFTLAARRTSGSRPATRTAVR